MKVLLFSDYGGIVPDVLKEYIKYKTFKENRTGEIVDFIERTAEIPDLLDAPSKASSSSLMAWFDVLGHDKIAYVGYNEELKEKKFVAVGTLNEHPCIVPFTVKDIDISKRWELTEYDGAEALVPLDDIVCIDEELNVFKRR